jgi:hypothetical protein
VVALAGRIPDRPADLTPSHRGLDLVSRARCRARGRPGGSGGGARRRLATNSTAALATAGERISETAPPCGLSTSPAAAADARAAIPVDGDHWVDHGASCPRERPRSCWRRGNSKLTDPRRIAGLVHVLPDRVCGGSQRSLTVKSLQPASQERGLGARLPSGSLSLGIDDVVLPVRVG